MSNIPRHLLRILTCATAALVAACFVFVFSSTSLAQEVASAPEADLALLIRLESDIQLLNSGKIIRNPDLVALKAERRLKDILNRNPNASFHFQATEALRQVQEYLGGHQLSIATFYLDRDHKLKGASKGSLKGAESRLSEIVQKYQRFSKMDEVLLKLAIVALKEDRLDDARIYARTLMCDYPTSPHIEAAFRELNRMGLAIEKD